MATEYRENTDGRARSLANLRPAWQPGQVTNPKGRPKGTGDRRIITNLLVELLEQPNAKTKKENAQIVAEALLRVCKRGNVKAIKELLDRVEGRVETKIVGELNSGTKRVL